MRRWCILQQFTWLCSNTWSSISAWLQTLQNSLARTFCGQNQGSCSTLSSPVNQVCQRTAVPYLVVNFGSYYLDCSLSNKLIIYSEQNCISPLYASNQSVCINAPLYNVDALISCVGTTSNITIFSGNTACLGSTQPDNGYFFTQNQCSGHSTSSKAVTYVPAGSFKYVCPSIEFYSDDSCQSSLYNASTSACAVVTNVTSTKFDCEVTCLRQVTVQMVTRLPQQIVQLPFQSPSGQR